MQGHQHQTDLRITLVYKIVPAQLDISSKSCRGCGSPF